MSEEKLYAVKNDEGEYWNFADRDGFFESDFASCSVTDDERYAKNVVRDHGGHVVALVEEPEKVVVSPEEAKLVKNCLWTNLQDEFLNNINLLFRGRRPEDITRLKSALTNGYTVANEKRYVLPMPYGADDDDPDDSHYAVVNRQYHAGPAWHQGPCVSFKKAREHYSVTQAEIDAAPDWVKTITPVEVTDDAD